MPSGLPVSATLRTDGTNDQIQLDASRTIDEPIVAVFWRRNAEPRGVLKDAIFLGSVWAPARHLFALPLVALLLASLNDQPPAIDWELAAPVLEVEGDLELHSGTPILRVQSWRLVQ